MAKKKINPYRVPIPKSSVDMKQIVSDASDRMVFQAWAVILGALADFSDMSTEDLLHLWASINTFPTTIRTQEDIAAALKEIESIVGISIPFNRIPSFDIKTKGDLERFTYLAEQNAFFSALGLIGYSIIHGKLLPEDRFVRVVKKALSLNEEISLGKDGRVTLEDILEMLKNEFSLILSCDNGSSTLTRLH